MAFTGRAGGRFQMRRVLNGETGNPGAGFWRIMRPGNKPDGTTSPPNDSDPAEFLNAAGREPVDGDIAVVTYAGPNNIGEFSCAFQYDAGVPEWVAAGQFIDGNLVVDGAVFSTVSLAVGIPNIDDALVWTETSNVPAIDPAWMGSGAFMGFADREGLNPNTLADQQEILLVGGQEDHIFFDGENLTLSGVTIEDPVILVTPQAPAFIPDDYAVGDVVSVEVNGETRLYRAIVAQTDTGSGVVSPTDPNGAMFWEDITDDVPRGPAVTVSDAAPASATEGDLWYDETIGRLFLFVAQAGQTDITVGTWADVTKN